MVDLIVVAGYLAIMLGIGWSNRHQSARSYWVAERRYGTGLVAASLVATIFGASSTMGIMGLGYARGLTGAWWALAGGIALVPFALLLAGRVRKLKAYTLPDILKAAYGEKISAPAGMVIAIAWCGVIAAQLVAGARIIGVVVSCDFQWALGLIAIVFILYTFWGGQVSVVKTDAWQLCLFAGGFVALFFLMAVSLHREPGMLGNLPPGHLTFPVSEGFGWYEVLVYYPLIVGLPYLVGPDIYSRIFCARDDRVARRAALAAAAVVIPLSFMLAAFGLLARCRFPQIAPEAVLPQSVSGIPAGVRAVILVGFLGTIMSSADTCLVSAATILSLNVISAFLPTSQDRQLKMTKAALLVVGAVSWLIAGEKQGIIGSLLLGYTVFVGGIVFPTLAVFVSRIRVTSTGAFLAVVLGGGAAVLGKIKAGAAMTAILGARGVALLEKALGPEALSIFPIILCLGVLAVGMRWAPGPDPQPRPGATGPPPSSTTRETRPILQGLSGRKEN